MRGAPSAARRRRQAALGDLCQQRLVTDLENPRGLGAVPAHALEHFPECLALGFSRPAASNLSETALGNGESRRRAVPVVPVVPVATAGHQGLDRLLPIGQHHQPAHHVFELPDVARPRVLREPRQRLAQELLVPTVLRVEPGQEPRGQFRNLFAALPQRGTRISTTLSR